MAPPRRLPQRRRTARLRTTRTGVSACIASPAGGRPGILSLEANLAVAPGALSRPLRVVEPLHRGFEQLGQPLEAAAFRAQLQQALLGVEVEVERRGHPVGVELRQVVLAGARVRD